ncbi:MAG TPA: isoaspartyl peptidase/L-asparaginase [Ferruginibacter sp.]|nr:isoaspartyl peptidase/L-asparaginase [Ferruginibacter sp.]HRE64076.1 isoaspartyl peptidase/L-asparaginase [Ferruginibacter sp.]
MSSFSIAIHGGAGTLLKEDISPELEQAYTNALNEALEAGYKILDQKGTALDAVVAATVSLENNILFNAGRGSVFTKKGLHEMDASVMEGHTLGAGAVAGVKNIVNPVLLAKEVMLHSDHVFLCAEGATEFALKRGIAMAGDDYFFSEFRYNQWKAMRDNDGYALDHSQQGVEQLMKDKKFGTVGAVACDAFGNIAAATSTGGMTNKKYGRIGDSPVIGAGTYANNQTCAISCTGHGEPFIKAVAAYDVSCRMQYKGLTLQEAMNEVVHENLIKLEAEGGMIGVDAQNNISMQFNSAGMYRAMKKSTGEYFTAIYK